MPSIINLKLILNASKCVNSFNGVDGYGNQMSDSRYVCEGPERANFVNSIVKYKVEVVPLFKIICCSNNTSLEHSNNDIKLNHEYCK